MLEHLTYIHQDDFAAWKLLNLHWLQGYDHYAGKIPYLLEEADFIVLNDPIKNILETGGQIWFAEMLTKQIVGTIGLVFHNNEWEINKLSVLPEFQKKGIGKELIQIVINFAKEMKIARLVLDSNSHLLTAIRLYEHFGFRYIQPRGHYATADIAMEKIL